MPSSRSYIKGNYLYDVKHRAIAHRNSEGNYVDSRNNILATSRASSTDSSRFSYEEAPEDRLGPIEDPNHQYYASRNRNPDTGSQLSSSAHERIAPSLTKIQTTTGSYQYPNGMPFDCDGLRPQSATGYGATPEIPYGKGYEQTRTPYRHETPIQQNYKKYKKSDKERKSKHDHYQDQALLNSTTVGAVGGYMTEDKLRFSPQGHQTMAPFAREADLASLSDWQPKKRDAEITKAQWLAMETLRISDQQQARDHYDSYKTMEHGRQLSNGKYEWVAVGGGRRRYWNDDYDDYIESSPAQQSATTGPRLSDGKFEWIYESEGNKCYWSDYCDDYIDVVPSQQKVKTSGSSRRSRR